MPKFIDLGTFITFDMPFFNSNINKSYFLDFKQPRLITDDSSNLGFKDSVDING